MSAEGIGLFEIHSEENFYSAPPTKRRPQPAIKSGFRGFDEGVGLSISNVSLATGFQEQGLNRCASC